MPPGPFPNPGPPGPPGPMPKPYPGPAHLNIRLITDSPNPLPLPGQLAPLQPLPSPTNEPRRYVKGIPPPPPPPGLRKFRVIKNDGFYRAWDRFSQRKERAKKYGRSKSEDETVATVERDVEGRPGHHVVENEDGVQSRENACTSYEEAAKSCRDKVDAIVAECRRLNQKYYDRMFNLPDLDTLVSLGADEDPTSVKDLVGVGAVKRVEDIFDDPEFFEDGPTANDIRQGNVGDCWFLAALTALSGKPELIERLCVARDEKVGVYGFVFFRDGEWISEVVDDRLALRYSDDQQQFPTDFLVFTRGDRDAMKTPLAEMSYAVSRLPKDFRESLRKGSNALYFGSCRDSNETWLPLIEKAYAKAHGDYQSIDGGVTGEGIEDLTGGIASYIRSENVLDKDQLWEELKQVNDKFLFGCGTRKGRDSDSADDEGFVRGHAYTVLDAREILVPPREEKKKKKIKKEQEDKLKTKDGKVRLLKLHNPWGNQEWNGPWSDGSKEWTPDVLKELNHTMGDDGTFFISFQDFLKFYPVIDRIRLIGPEWTVTQQWTAVNIPSSVDYLDTSFRLTVTKKGPVVLVLSQPDVRYFRGLAGRYKFSLHFRLYKDGEDTYLLRSMDQSGNMRSCNAETELEPGTYELLLKITAERFEDKKTAEQLIRDLKEDRREKLLNVGKSFDLTHSKGKLRELEKNNELNDAKTDLERNRRIWARSRERKRRERTREKLRRKRHVAEYDKKKEEKRKRLEEKRKKEVEERKKKGIYVDRDRKLRPRSKTEGSSGSDISDGDLQPAEEVSTKPAGANGDSSNQEQVLTPEPSSPSTLQEKAKEEEAIPADDADTIPPADVVVFEPVVKTLTTAEPPKEENPVEPVIVPAIEEVPQDQPNAPTPRVDPTKYKAEHEDKPELRGLPQSPPNLPFHQRQDTRDSVYIIPQNQGRGLPPGHGPHRMMPIRKRSFSGSRSRSNSPISSICEDDFPWDDAIDGPPSPLSDSDSESDYNSADEMYAGDPWQAACVIGLRVCSMDENAKIEIVKGVGRGRRRRGEIAQGRARSPA